jgi:hypothetical protein
MPRQRDLFFDMALDAAADLLGSDPQVAARDRALTRVEEGAGAAWMAEAREAILTVSNRLATFTSQAVWRQMREKPREPRALGAAMRKAVTEGLIVATGTFRPEGSHKRPLAVWRKA